MARRARAALLFARLRLGNPELGLKPPERLDEARMPVFLHELDAVPGAAVPAEPVAVVLFGEVAEASPSRRRADTGGSASPGARVDPAASKSRGHPPDAARFTRSIRAVKRPLSSIILSPSHRQKNQPLSRSCQGSVV